MLNNSTLYALVAIKGLPVSADRLYTYSVPNELTDSAKAGLLCSVPFGRKKEAEGVIVSVSETTDVPRDKIRLITSLGEEEPDILSLSESGLSLVLYIKDRYFCTYWDAVSLVLPFGKLSGKKGRQQRVKDPLAKLERHPFEETVLNPEQQKAYEEIKKGLSGGGVHLLFGVTGSGKTHVYIKLIDDVLSSGKTALFLVPEIALTYQIVSRLYDRYGESLAVLHSALTPAERKHTFRLIAEGKKKIVVGTRSALFTPIKSLGLIIIDEEQENSYKSEMTPKYGAREIAAFKANREKALLLIASATPSFESFRLAESKVIGFSEIKERFNGGPLPKVVLVDMHDEIDKGNSTPFGSLLVEEISRNLKNGEQTVLFMNHRGYNTFVSCLDCGEAIVCPYCGVTMPYHKKSERLICHYCGYSVPVPEKCPSCGGKTMKFSGVGTQKAEEDLAKIFPEARILRMDADTVSEKGSRDAILSSFSRGECDILLGTQMITKGLDFPNVTLVGVLLADTMLFSSDFRAFEKTFSLMTQVVGRAGRSQKTGRAIIQSFYPSHRVFRYALDQDYIGFYRNETSFRKTMLYPPFCDICQVSFIAPTEAKALQAAERFENALRSAQGELPLRVIPAKATHVPMVDTKPRVRILLKCIDNRKQRSVLSGVYLSFIKDPANKEIRVDIDMNPVNIG
ncbi:MAG: primosomal protein N' [Clostridia bacterium]|nr:primosomal protein N' [Clostridia bacterium]